MKERLLCDIPIYGISKGRYIKRLKKEKQNFYNGIIISNTEDRGKCKIWSQDHIEPYSVWKYNQMVGFIEILVQNYDVRFNIFMNGEERHMCFSGKKKYYKNLYANGLSFYSGDKTNHEIIDEIVKYVKMAEKDFLKKKSLCVDKTILENILGYTDIKKMINDINK